MKRTVRACLYFWVLLVVGCGAEQALIPNLGGGGGSTSGGGAGGGGGGGGGGGTTPTPTYPKSLGCAENPFAGTFKNADASSSDVITVGQCSITSTAHCGFAASLSQLTLSATLIQGTFKMTTTAGPKGTGVSCLPSGTNQSCFWTYTATNGILQLQCGVIRIYNKQ